MLDSVLESCGYGQEFDITSGVLVRRRWWLARVALGEECDLDLFQADADLWRSYDLSNELREVRLGLERLGRLMLHPQADDMSAIAIRSSRP